MRKRKRLVEFARGNRKTPTLAESMLWADLRGSRLHYKFRRQQPIGPYIVDFVCFEKRLIVEVDGWTHTFEEVHARDVQREGWLHSQGFRVLRFDDDDVMADRVAVVDSIYEVLQENNSPDSGSRGVAF